MLEIEKYAESHVNKMVYGHDHPDQLSSTLKSAFMSGVISALSWCVFKLKENNISNETIKILLKEVENANGNG